MIRQITCYGCKTVLMKFNDQTGCILHDGMPAGIRAWGILLNCLECGRTMRWNGAQIVTRMKRKSNSLGAQMVVAKRP